MDNNVVTQEIWGRYKVLLKDAGVEKIDTFIKANPDQVIADICVLIGYSVALETMVRTLAERLQAR